jgi:formylglycine-generating enzyme required for sulfatase activity
MTLSRIRLGATLSMLLAVSTAPAACNAISGVNDFKVVPADAAAADASLDSDAAGPDAQEAGPDSKEAGPDSQDSGPDSQESGIDCDAGSTGVGSPGDPCCKANALACAEHAQKLVVFCDAKSLVWIALQSCSGNQICTTEAGPNQGSCQDPVKACVGKQPGDKVCDGITQVVCGPDLVTSEQTACPVVCVNGACTGQCTPGTKQCTDLVPQTCNTEGAWVDGPACAYACSAGACTGVCAPNAKQCSGNIPQNCDASGQWVDGAACPLVCSAGVCAATCAAGTKQCSGNTAQTCEANGTWKDATACPYLCVAGGCTGVCAPDQKDCQALTPRTCDATGQWQSATAACPFVCTAGSCTGECSPGAKQCSGLAPETCDDTGHWQTGADCTYVCNAGACSGVCTPGAKQCNGQVPQTCNDQGQWDSGAACSAVCTAGTCAGACSPGSTQCNGIELQTCDSNGQWGPGTACTFACASGKCTGVCSPGTKDCSALVPRSCDSSGQWQSGAACPYLCNAGACEGVCAPGSKGCVGNVPQTCQANATWSAGTACAGTTPTCQAGQCVAFGASCEGLAANCGLAGNQSCCATALVPGGTFFRSYDAVTYLDKSFPATVSDFKLDVYEVTTGRFRKFVAGYPGNLPAIGAGKNPNNPSDPGWSAADSAAMPLTQAALITALKCNPTQASWTDTPGAKENRPINCVNRFEAFAFCIWDGGRLPTEAEWNYAAAGGGDSAGQRAYPWSVPPTSVTIDPTYASYSGAFSAVGSLSPKGDARWGHMDMAGNAQEWVLDYFVTPYPSGACNNCAVTTPGGNATLRGGAKAALITDMLTSARFSRTLGVGRRADDGIRCARSP